MNNSRSDKRLRLNVGFANGSVGVSEANIETAQNAFSNFEQREGYKGSDITQKVQNPRPLPDFASERSKICPSPASG